ncbi:hypothetical protein L6164_003357 [Bauhinia variegata]|uniref:Uncharacterized protein n=1 Tax=Bauhinia variegata TaxID=167791 RepID=A0ACB9Q118_BAUVA|nr:hypothetical protein L6164_003357 [Bauhinia variegata]
MASNSKDPKQNGGFFASLASSLSNFTKSVNGLLGYEGLEVINPEGGTEDAEEEARKGRWKDEDRDSHWKMMQKYIGSDITSMVTLPVIIFEPMTMVQKMTELMEYSYLLDMANECEDPYMRLVYASSFFISVYYGLQRTWKPFNPILGETYEMVNHGGITFIAEQVSHHPPMSAAHAENEHFTYDITSKVKTKFLGNSVDVYPLGRTRVTLKKDGVVLDLVPPPTKVNNLIFGRTWIDSPGEMVLTNMTTGDKVVLYFQPCGWFGAGRYEVDGYVYNADEEPKILITGKWNESMSYQPCDPEGEPLPGTELKESWRVAEAPKNDKFQYTYFAHKINSFDTAPKKLLASDSRLRPDRMALEKGDLSKSGYEKSSLEERQRAEKRNREAKGHKFSPRWFDQTDEVAATPWGDLEVYQYNGKYAAHRQAIDSSDSIDNADNTTEFNPWQYDNVNAELGSLPRGKQRTHMESSEWITPNGGTGLVQVVLLKPPAIAVPVSRSDFGCLQNSRKLVPVIPRASRSPRGRGAVRKRDESNQIHAFEILASVAGNFLQENENSIPDDAAFGKDRCHLVGINLEDKQEEEAESFKGDFFEHGSCSENDSGCVHVLQGKHDDQRVMGDSSFHVDHLEGQGQNILEREGNGQLKVRIMNKKINSVTSCFDGLIEPDYKASNLHSSENYVEKPLLEDFMNIGSLTDGSTRRKLVNRDDDENYVNRKSGKCFSSKVSDPLDMVIEKVENVSSSQSCGVGQKLKDASPYKIEDNKVMDDESSQKMYPFKKRKIFTQTLSTASDKGSNCQGIFDSSDTRVNDGNQNAAVEDSSSITGRKVHPGSRDSNVKLSIKSFKVPELFIDIPETATIGSLKRSVMEAVTTILGDELHVGILLQGKKVRDDSKTLFQTGISQEDKHQRLGFMLEPSHTRNSRSAFNEDPCFLTTGSPLEVSRQSTSLMLQRGTYNVPKEPSVIKIESCAEGDLKMVPSRADTSVNNTMSKCRALVAVPAINMEALAVVPLRRKNPDFAQRRIRRPFSVPEVEALVQAVEKLGTGRWRDVKQRAFDHAKHRTYVDLKDKWKTLVHTARISPQQRRGEPVPQELLDRVLAAHAYWSQQQCPEETSLVETPGQQHISSLLSTAVSLISFPRIILLLAFGLAGLWEVLKDLLFVERRKVVQKAVELLLKII